VAAPVGRRTHAATLAVIAKLTDPADTATNMVPSHRIEEALPRAKTVAGARKMGDRGLSETVTKASGGTAPI
jgi:hypothetical protein